MKYLLFLLVGCSSIKGKDNLAFKHHLDEYRKHFKQYYPKLEVPDIPIYINAKKDVAYCHRSSISQEIEIILDRYKDLSYLQKTAVIFHEMGHCHLKRDHQQGKLSDDCPKSIMNEHIPSHACLNLHWFQYIEELFTPI